MKVLVWYNLNHHSFKTEYRKILHHHEVGEINKFNHMLVQIINLNPSKIKFSEKTASALESLADRIRYGKQKKTKIVYVNKYPWWYKK